MLGNVTSLVDSAGNLAREYGYTRWGATNGGTDHVGFSNVDRARFKGALWMVPQVDLYYMRARWYEPKTGRFLSEDPIGLAGGTNLYRFGGGDPINRSDPTGLDCNPTCDPIVVEGDQGSPPRMCGYHNFHDLACDQKHEWCVDAGGIWLFHTGSCQVAGGEGGGSEGSPLSDDIGDIAVRKCMASSFMAVVTVASDATLVIGALAMRAARAGATLLRGTALSLGRRGLWKLGGRGAMRDYLGRAAVAQGEAVELRQGYAIGVGVTATHSAGAGTEFDARDYVPGWASKRAIGSVASDCWHPGETP